MPSWLADQRDAAAAEAQTIAVESSQVLQATLVEPTGPWARRAVASICGNISGCPHLAIHPDPDTGIWPGPVPAFSPFPAVLVCRNCFTTLAAHQEPRMCVACGTGTDRFSLLVTRWYQFIIVGALCLSCHGAEMRHALDN
jgi:hypothetical protein